MPDPKDTTSFFRKVVKFVANPSTDWAELGAPPEDMRETEFAKGELKAMIERKRRNDFVRKREFDMGAILARAVRAQGRDDEALELTEAVEAAAADDDVDAQVLWRGIRAPILARAGQIAEAEALARAAHERARQTEMPELQGFALTELASALQLAGRIDEARAAMADAIVVYAKKGDVASEGRARRLLAMLERAG